MMDAGLLPVLVTAGVVGSFGLAWHANVRRTTRRHASRHARARERGWCYAAMPHGFTVTGRTLTCGWSLRSDAHAGASVASFSLGAPDEHRAIAAFGTGSAPGALAHSQAWPLHPSVRNAHTRGLWIEAAAIEDVMRIADPEVARLVHDFVVLTGPGGGLRAWLSPHGVEIRCAHPLHRWAEIEALARLGMALARRTGLA